MLARIGGGLTMSLERSDDDLDEPTGTRMGGECSTPGNLGPGKL
jgi:hypothetical protein